MKITETTADWPRKYLQKARALRRNSSMRGKKLKRLESVFWSSMQRKIKVTSGTHTYQVFYTSEDRVLCRASKFTRLYLTVKAFDGWTRDPWLELEFFLHVKWRERYGSVHLVNCSKTKINKVTEGRSWFSQGKIVSVQRLCSVELNHRGKSNWVVQNLSAVCEVPISKKFFAWKSNLRATQSAFWAGKRAELW